MSADVRATSLADLLSNAARGRPPAADGAVTVLDPPPGPVRGVLAFTAHHVVALGLDPDAVRARLPGGDLIAPTSPAFLTWAAERLGADPGPVDAVLVTFGGEAVPGLRLVPSEEASHPRVERAMRYRTDVRVFEDEGRRGLLLIGRGLAGRWEVAFEVEPGARGHGLGRGLAAAARAVVPAGEPLFAQVTPGNAASLRALLAAGYVPVGSEVLFPKPVVAGP
jgi:hypothetical protein